PSERLYSLGRYFAKGRMPKLHEAHRHSQRIIDQKQTSSPRFEESFTEFLTRLAGQTNIDLVWSVPCTTGGKGQEGADRLQWYRQTAARLLGAEESTHVREAKPLEAPLKGLGHQARLAANSNRFAVEGDLAGKSILLIDDVWTTGSTLNAVTEVARAAGATSVIKVVFGLNQVPPVPQRRGWYAADSKYLRQN
ncbi:MAG: phosphoribosyltransferase family protein, partial [Actinomycetes bacterium]